MGGRAANESLEVSRTKPTTKSMELSGMPPKNPSGKTTETEGRILQMHQIMKKTWNDSDSITAAPGWITRQPRRNLAELLQGTQNTDSGQPQQSYGYEEAINEMF